MKLQVSEGGYPAHWNRFNLAAVEANWRRDGWRGPPLVQLAKELKSAHDDGTVKKLYCSCGVVLDKVGVGLYPSVISLWARDRQSRPKALDKVVRPLLNSDGHFGWPQQFEYPCGRCGKSWTIRHDSLTGAFVEALRGGQTRLQLPLQVNGASPPTG